VRKRGWLGLAATGVTATAALAAGVVVERRVVRQRATGAAGADRLGGLRGDPVTVRTDDGVALHAEVDEAPDVPIGEHEPTLVFVHGYALNLDCWHFQRQYFRGKHRLVFYDQRSHGRSKRTDKAHATIDQLGHDLCRVIEQLVPEGPVVLVGHSMGGMAIMAFAEHHPDVFGERVRGVALISTSAGGLKTHRVVSKLIPDAIGGQLGPRLIATLARAPELVDRVRRRGSNLGFLLAEEFAFGSDVPESYVEFVDNMLAKTPFEVLALFFPNFDTLDKFTVLALFARIPTYIIGGTKDVFTPISHSRKMASRLPDAKLVECPGAGHMVLLEQKDAVNAAIEELYAEALDDRAERVS
jgi:pimeloyl-ACP methyl ester carboxylesterase